MAYSATFNFNPNRGQHEEDVYYVRVSPRAGRHTDADTNADGHTDCYTNSTLRLRQQLRNTDGYSDSHSYSATTPTPRSEPTPRGVQLPTTRRPKPFEVSLRRFSQR